MDKNKHTAARPAPASGGAGAAANSPQALRRQAEKRLLKMTALTPNEIAAFSPEEAGHMLHELQVHQIELEMQNEELRDAQVALDAARARYFDLYDLAPVGYCTVSERGLIMQANLTAASLLGTTRGELLKQPFTRFIHKDDEDRYYLYRKKIVGSGEPQSCELRMMKNDGTQFWGHWSASVAHDALGVLELRTVVTDITERKRLDQGLQEKNVALERAVSAAEKANLAKSGFLSRMSHELRTPLNAILGFSQLIETGSPPPSPTQKRNVDHILKAGWYLLALIDEILDLAVIESGTISLSMEAISLDEVMRECQVMVESQAQTHGIRVAFPRFDVPCHVKADRNRVKQVLSNLLSNAIKYNKPDGAVVMDWVVSTPGRIRINVRDTGDGLSPDKLAMLFQTFNRLGRETGAEQGTGIGLVVSKRLVELMNGAIGVESTVGKGSVFWIELDVSSAPQPVAGPVHAGARAATPGQIDAPLRTVLYVEDNPANLTLVEEIIARRPDIRLLTATDGVRGVEIARAVLPDVILMDINMPGISGIEAMKILADDPATARIPVVALTAAAMLGDFEYGLRAGFFRYITKPIKINEFMDTLDVALEFSISAANRTSRTRPA